MKKYIYAYFIALIGLSSCEDTISIEVDEGTIQLAVDAFITSENDIQKVILKKTKQFFDEVSQEAFEADSVYITDNIGNKYIFEDLIGNGEYIWSQIDSSIVSPGRTYFLTIKDGDVVYSSESQSYSVAQVDSINWAYSAPAFAGQTGTYIVEGVIRDIPGERNFTWVRVKVNGKYDSRKNSIIIAEDNSNVGLSTDGELFIAPAAFYSPDVSVDTIGLGDVVTYETWSVNEETSLFWLEVVNQNVDGALGAIFATPTANVRTNISSSSNLLSQQAVGWFSVSMISVADQIILEKEGENLSFPID